MDRKLMARRKERSWFLISSFAGVSFGLLFFLLLIVPINHAYAYNGIRALDEQAVLVKAPDRVFMVAVAAAGARLIAVGEHGVIAYSDDNGASWRQSTVPVMVTLTDVVFVNDEDGWAIGHYGVILHTADRGTTWQLQLNGLQANQLTLSAAKQAVINKNPSLGTSMALKRADFFLSAGADKPFLTLRATSPNNATAFGAYRLAMTTEDGGKTWSDVSLNVGDALSHNLYSVIDAGSDIYLVGESGLVFRSTDGGSSYPAVTAPTDGTLFGVLSPEVNSVLVFGVAGLAFCSDDDGKTWQQLNIGTTTNITTGIVLKSGSLLLAAEDGRLFKSDDKGVTYSPLSTIIPMAISGLAEAADNSVIVVGSAGIIKIPASAVAKN